MFSVYNDHKKHHARLPDMNNVEEVRLLAQCCAETGTDAFYRVFELTDKSPTGEQFVIAFSVLNGKVTERHDVTFPKEHW